jgi:2-C-methyl-D-erythritol 4-phosphate cytidylyltransferase
MFGKKRHAELIARFDAIDTRLHDLEYFVHEALRPLATKVDVEEVVDASTSDTQNHIEDAVQRLDSFRIDEHERVHGILKAQADRLELNAQRIAPAHRTAPGGN